MKKFIKNICTVTGASLFLLGIASLGGNNGNVIRAYAATPSPVVQEAAVELPQEVLDILEAAGIQPRTGSTSFVRQRAANVGTANIWRAQGTFSWDRAFTGTVFLTINANSMTQVPGTWAQGTTTVVNGPFQDTGSNSSVRATGHMTQRN